MARVNLSSWAIEHRSLVLYTMLMSLVAGVYAFVNLGRNEDPSFTFKAMVVQTYWPGASQADTMAQVTDRIEQKIQEIDNLDYVKSYTTAGESTVFVFLRQDTPKQAVPEAWQQVRNKVQDIVYQLPDGIRGPFFNDDFGDTFGVILALTADGFSQRELRDYAEQIKTRVQQVDDVAKVQIVGAQSERIYVEFNSRRLAQLGLDSSAIIQALASQNAVVQSGVMRTADNRVLVGVSGELRTIDDFANINLALGGRVLSLRDLATITRATADPADPMFRFNGQPAIGIAIAMRDGGDILRMGTKLETTIAQLTKDLPVGIEPHLVANQPHIVDTAVGEFTQALFEAVVIVLAISFLSLGVRAGSVVAMSIPLVLAAVFVAMDILGIDLQRVSLGALIIALGLLVDDAMITVESMVTRLEQGHALKPAATYAYTATAFPMLTGTLVTIIGFVPIGFAKSNAGEYTFSLFAVVALALIISWFVAVLCAPLIGTWLLQQRTEQHSGSQRFMTYFQRLLVRAMCHAKTTVAIITGIFVLSLFLLPFIQQQFFPSADREELIVDITLPQDATIDATAAAAQALDGLLAQDEAVAHWSTYVGRGAVRFYLPLDVKLQNPFFAEAVVVAKSLDVRDELQQRLARDLRERLPGALVRIYPLELGPPVGWPVQYRISGSDPVKLREIAQQVAVAMAQNPHADNINFDWMEPIRKLEVEVDQSQARRLGLSSASIAQAINRAVRGDVATQVRDNIYLIDVVVRADASERDDIEHLQTLAIPLPNGVSVPLATVANVRYSQALPMVWRRDRMPTLSVRADLREGVMPATAVAELQPAMAQIRAHLPAGYRIDDGGAVEESRQSQQSVAAVFPIAIILMLTVLMVQLQRFSYLLLVVSVAPLGLIGVVAALLALSQPLGFVALLGIVALIGMIVRNSVILVHQIHVEQEAGHSPWDAVIHATTLRFRPIMLTSVAAILGMVPIANTVFWGPMATAIMGGLAVATVLTLLFLPALYVICFRVNVPATP
ncbi:efflux RND transporter permease subunit [Teredinibacter turnerae]|uniref:efflux RND transporter permease subunit n=1 Tax=Teredinibacter turnerae TaxID=2426 RepID=UPI000428A850|nr:efflux RND transporter permease subunit [Teredinibacter turnerae]